MTKLLVGAVMMGSVAGCIIAPSGPEPQMASSGQIGCAPAQIQISDHKTPDRYTSTWTAACNSRTFYCTWTGGAQGEGQTSCKEAMQAQ